jgi:hypothetical protein
MTRCPECYLFNFLKKARLKYARLRVRNFQMAFFLTKTILLVGGLRWTPWTILHSMAAEVLLFFGVPERKARQLVFYP